MNATDVRDRRTEAMRDFEDGKLPQAEVELSNILAQAGSIPDSSLGYEISRCLCDRATVRRFTHNWGGAIEDLSRSEKLTQSLGQVARLTILPSIYYIQALLFMTPYSSSFDLAGAARSVDKLREYSRIGWVTDSLEAELAFANADWDKAAALFLRVADALQQEQWQQGVAGSKLRAAESYVEMARWRDAEQQINAILPFLQTSGSPDTLAKAELIMARVQSAYKEHQRAWNLVNQSIDRIETLIRRFHDVWEQQAFVVDKLKFYDTAFQIALVKEDHESCWRAWGIAERAKSFYLCQLVANADVPLFEGVEPTDVAALKELESELDSCERTLSRMPPQAQMGPEGESLQSQKRVLSEQKSGLLSSMMKKNPRWGALRSPPKVEVKSLVTKLDQHWTPLSYFWQCMPRGDSEVLHIFWSDSSRLPQHRSLTLTKKELTQLDATRMRLRGDVPASIDILPVELAPKIMPDDLVQALKADCSLLISPHGRLKALPVQCMQCSDGSLLIEHGPVQFIPTLNLLGLSSSIPARKKVMIVGCPTNDFGDRTLTDVETEVKDLTAIWNRKRPGLVASRIILHFESPETVGLTIQSWSDFGILHFACHGEFPEGRPFDAALRLGTDAVRASELFALHLGNAQIFLSACSLGRQHQSTGSQFGDEWIGFYLPLLYAGAQTLLMSLYDADSETARIVMTELHDCLTREMLPVQALQQAALRAIRESQPVPLWANWYLVGLPGSA